MKPTVTDGREVRSDEPFKPSPTHPPLSTIVILNHPCRGIVTVVDRATNVETLYPMES